jgi:hypothetical protein
MANFLRILLLLLPLSSFAQRFGGTPPSQKWKEIDTDSVRIIFPARLDSQAQRIASLVHYLAANQPSALGARLKKVNIVLQNQTTVANGYVGLGPYRSEFYLTPSPNSFSQGSISWTDQLALHEYRHVQQFNNFHQGLSKLMSRLFGQEGYALAINASIPDWFYEGDAVLNETLLTKQGRGRLPYFMNAFPALWQAGKQYSWMKLRNGSMKDYVPDHYRLGYLMVNYGHQKYGTDFWRKVTTDASCFKGLFYPFQKAIKRHAGISYKIFRSDALNFYRNDSSARNDPQSPGPFPLFSLNRKVVTNYMFPYSVSEDSLIYLLAANNKRAAFYLKQGDKVKRLRTRNISLDEQYSYRNGKIVYASYERDPRWSWRDYSVITLLDLATNKSKKVTSRSKYFSPDINQEGNRIAAVEMAPDGRSEIHVLDAKNGEVLNRVRSVDVTVFADPKFIAADSLVCTVRLRDGRMALAIVNLSTGSVVRLTPPSFNVVGYPNVGNNMIYFTASYGGNDDIFAIRKGDTTVYRVTNGPLGNYFVNVANGKMTWSTFTAEGYQLQQLAEAALIMRPMEAVSIEQQQIPFPVSRASNIQPIAAGQITSREFATGDYKKSTRLLNFHSWRPYYEDPEFSFSVYGENVLNTLQTEVYYLYNQNENTNAAGFSSTFGGWFPYISIGSQMTFGRKQTVGNRLRQWNQLDSRIGLSVPLQWISGRTFKRLQLGTNYFYRNEFNRGAIKDSIDNQHFSYLQHFISWGQQVEAAVQHIFPRLGYDLSFQYQHAITQFNSMQWNAAMSAYLPGITASHSLVVTGAWQETGIVAVKFSNRFPYSRGYHSRYFSRMWRLSGNYHFPIAYPDWGFANILYLQRVRGNLFYDFTKVYDLQKNPLADQRSLGGELYVDTKWWNQHPLTFGLRWSYLLDTDFALGRKRTGVLEFILPVSIIPR